MYKVAFIEGIAFSSPKYIWQQDLRGISQKRIDEMTSEPGVIEHLGKLYKQEGTTQAVALENRIALAETPTLIRIKTQDDGQSFLTPSGFTYLEVEEADYEIIQATSLDCMLGEFEKRLADSTHAKFALSDFLALSALQEKYPFQSKSAFRSFMHSYLPDVSPGHWERKTKA